MPGPARAGHHRPGQTRTNTGKEINGRIAFITDNGRRPTKDIRAIPITMRIENKNWPAGTCPLKLRLNFRDRAPFTADYPHVLEERV
jgi:hypothetical protein